MNHMQETTQQQYALKNGDALQYDESGHVVYTAERTALHEQIIETMLEGKKSSASPFLLFLGGGILTGKNIYRQHTLKKMQERGIDLNEVLVNRTSFFNKLPEFAEHSAVRHPEKLPFMADEYRDIMKKLADRVMARKICFLFVDHGENAELVNYVAEKAVQAEYKERVMIGVYVGPENFEENLKMAASSDLITLQDMAYEFNCGFSRNWLQYTKLFGYSELINTEQGNVQKVAIFNNDTVREIRNAGKLKEFYDSATIKPEQTGVTTEIYLNNAATQQRGVAEAGGGGKGEGEADPRFKRSEKYQQRVEGIRALIEGSPFVERLGQNSRDRNIR